MAVVSPCVGICALDAVSGLCRGCRRTVQEIAGWMAMDDAQRSALILALQDRPEPAPAPRGPRTAAVT